MDKQILLKNIFSELNQIPEAYLQHWLNLIRTFRQGLPENSIHEINSEESFDWEELANEIMENRNKDNQSRFQKIDSIL